MLVIPLQAAPAQTLTVALPSNQNCTLNLYQKLPAILTDCGSLYMDVYLSGSLIIGGVVCQDANRIVRDVYLGFIGDLAFFDLQGTDDPDYTGLGVRWILTYLSPDDLAAVGLTG
jgi:hypothetical protein